MANSGLAYVTSKEGIIRVIIIILGCIAFALIADSGHGDVIDWVLAAYIISWVFSLLSYFFIATTLSSKMECGVSYETVDVCLSVFSFFHCLMASIVLAMYLSEHQEEKIAADIFGFLLSIAYAVEIYFLKENAPESLQYLVTKNGILKAVICLFGCTTFALLDVAGYESMDSGCDSARKWVLAAFIISWGVSVILLLCRITPLASMVALFDKIDFIWSVFSFVNFLVAAIVLACYLDCNGHPAGSWRQRSYNTRIACVVFGFITAILYAVEAFFLKSGSGSADVSPK